MLGLNLPTFVFQLINFLVLLAILARFFYRPLMAAVAKREAAITTQREAAAREAQEAEATRERIDAERRAAEAEAQAMLARARLDAARQSERASGEAREEAERIIQAAREAAAQETRSALKNVEERLVESAVRLAESVIERAAGRSLDEALLERLLEDGTGLRSEPATPPGDAAAGSSAVTVDVAREPTSAGERLLEQAVRRALPADAPPARLSYELHPEILAGCRIHTGNVVIDLSLKRMLSELRLAPPAESDA